MTRDEAEDFIGTYRVAVRRWALVLSGMADGDAGAMRLWLEGATEELGQIAETYPDFAKSVDVLRGLRRGKNESRIDTERPEPSPSQRL